MNMRWSLMVMMWVNPQMVMVVVIMVVMMFQMVIIHVIVVMMIIWFMMIHFSVRIHQMSRFRMTQKHLFTTFMVAEHFGYVVPNLIVNHSVMSRRHKDKHQWRCDQKNGQRTRITLDKKNNNSIKLPQINYTLLFHNIFFFATHQSMQTHFYYVFKNY